MEDHEARKRLDEVESRMSVLEESVNKAVRTLMPKVDSLLAGITGEQTTSYSRTSVSPYSSEQTTSHSRTPTSLVEIAGRGDYEALLCLLVDTEIVAQSNPQRTDDGDTALHVAARGGHLKAVIVLVGAVVKVDATGHRLRTPLHCAAAHGHLAVAQRLLLAGAQIDAEDSDGYTPLSLAAKAKRWEMVYLLLERGASATKCKDDDKCALTWASQAGRVDAVRELLRKGASSNNRQMELALMKAKSAAVVWAFVDTAPDIEQIGGLGLVNAGCRGRMEPLMALLKAGVDINVTDSAYGTALYYAASNGHMACVRELLQRGADVNRKHNLGGTPLHQASRRGFVQCVRALLDAGANTTERDNEGKTPLEIASWNVRRILDRQQ